VNLWIAGQTAQRDFEFVRSTGEVHLTDVENPKSAIQFPKSRSARAMQDGVCLALLQFLQQATRFQCGLTNDLDTAPFRLH